MVKEYGKLTTSQFSELIGYIPVLLSLIKEVNNLLAGTSLSKFNETMTGDYSDYCHVYEEPFAKHLALVVVGTNQQDGLHAMATAPDPSEAVLEELRHMHEFEDDRPWHEGFEPGEWMALILAFGRSITSMATYGRSISGLLEDVRERNNQEALFKATLYLQWWRER